MKPTLKKLLNEETSKIWDYVNSKSEIKIVPDDDYSVNIIENDNNKAVATIWIDSENQRPDYFVHELLHIKNYCDGFLISKLIDKYFWDYRTVSLNWDRQFRNLIGNIIDHEKMFPKYLELGFEENEFVGDFHERKCSIDEITYEMKICSHPSIYSYKYITAKFFLIKGTLDSTINYEVEEKELYKLAPNLYKTLDSFWYSILNLEPPYSKLNQEILVKKFLQEIENIYSKI